jgi:positive regulator of sigma E activity
MVEKGIVDRVEGKLITVRCVDTEKCRSCGGGCIGDKQGRVFQALNSRSISLKKGDMVEVYLDAGRAVWSGFMVLILPLLLFFPFYYAAAYLLQGAGEAVKVLSGVTGIALGFGVNFIRKRIIKDKDMPEISSAAPPLRG